jgi:hypothetical protein
MKQMELLWERLEPQPGSKTVIAAFDHAKLKVMQYRNPNPHVRIVKWISSDEIIEAKKEGRVLVCFKDSCRWNAEKTGVDPMQEGAVRVP